MWVRASSMKFALSKKLYGGVQCKGQFHWGFPFVSFCTSKVHYFWVSPGFCLSLLESSLCLFNLLTWRHNQYTWGLISGSWRHRNMLYVSSPPSYSLFPERRFVKTL
jgi:hypothetical protein